MLRSVTNIRFVALSAAALGLLIIGMNWSWSNSSVSPLASPTTPEEALWQSFSEPPLRVKAFKALDRSTADRAQFRVVISAEPDTSLPHGWRAGDNIRWVTLQRTAGEWVIADVAVQAGA